MKRELLNWLGGGKRVRAEKAELWLISAKELLEARQEAKLLCKGEADAEGLCLNAAILARAARRNGLRLFADGEAVLNEMDAERIGRWMERYLSLCKEENPSCCEQDGQEQLLEGLREAPYERLKWKVLRSFGVLPSEQRAREMTDGDYLYCVLQMELDEEDFLSSLCPSCRAETERPRCFCCGEPLPEENPGFDEKRFEELKHGDVCG